MALGLAIGLGIWAHTLDLPHTKGYLLDLAADLGVPPTALAELEVSLAQVPDLVPVPLLGGRVSLPLPLGVLEVEGAFLTDGILVGLGMWPAGGLALGDPPVTVDLGLAAYHVGLSWNVGIDLGLLAVAVGVGGALCGGGIVPRVTTTDAVWEPILAAIPWDGITWSAVGGTLTTTVELGLPFLRLFVRGGLFLPVTQAPGAWGIRVGGYSAAAGMVIRF